MNISLFPNQSKIKVSLANKTYQYKHSNIKTNVPHPKIGLERNSRVKLKKIVGINIHVHTEYLWEVESLP